jgi:hypothetical protein
MPMMWRHRRAELANEAIPPRHRSADTASEAHCLGSAGARPCDVAGDMPRPNRSPETVSVHGHSTPMPIGSGLNEHHPSQCL